MMTVKLIYYTISFEKPLAYSPMHMNESHIQYRELKLPQTNAHRSRHTGKEYSATFAQCCCCGCHFC